MCNLPYGVAERALVGIGDPISATERVVVERADIRIPHSIAIRLSRDKKNTCTVVPLSRCHTH